MKRSIQIPEKIQKPLTIVLAIGLAIHFVVILAYCFREQLPPTTSKIVDRYTVPLFHQNWKLFAPDLPRYDVNLEYRYARNSPWSEWADASQRFGYNEHSRIETIEQGFNTELGWQVVNNFYARDGRKQFDRIVQSSAYASALFFVMRMHQLKLDPETPDSVQIRLNFKFTPQPDRAYTFQTSTLEFPVYVPVE